MSAISAMFLVAASSTAVGASPNLDQVFSAAPPDARAAFELAGTTLVHRDSGFRCPAVVASMTLTGVEVLPIPGLSGVYGAACRYGDVHGPESALFFSNERPNREVLSRAYCQALAGTFGATLRRGLPGANRMVGPDQVLSFGEVPVRGQPSRLWSCAWVRAPFSMQDEAVRVAMVRASDGWTVRAVQIPQPQSGPVVQLSYALRTILLIRAAVGAP